MAPIANIRSIRLRCSFLADGSFERKIVSADCRDDRKYANNIPGSSLTPLFLPSAVRMATSGQLDLRRCTADLRHELP
jgi:hypothetical protein